MMNYHIYTEETKTADYLSKGGRAREWSITEPTKKEIDSNKEIDLNKENT